MRRTLLDLLSADHANIRTLLDEVRNDIEPTCFSTFRTLKALVVAHSKAEEFALYELFEDPKQKRAVSLQHFSFEGYEEHDLIDFLMKEMVQTEEITPQWKAQLKVLKEMLEHHFKLEEEEFFPQVMTVLSQDELLNLAEVYLIERDQIFAKKNARPISQTTLAPHYKLN
jgi:hypothetical protein